MNDSLCGIDCTVCELRNDCCGCAETCGRPFGGACVLAACCNSRGYERCDQCDDFCNLKKQLISEFNSLGIDDMAEIKDLNALKGSFVNLEYNMPTGLTIKLFDDNKIYLGNQICKKSGDRCYGLVGDENHILVCEYGNDGRDAEIVLYKKRNCS